jgi:sensor domain CHASE-containing protein
MIDTKEEKINVMMTFIFLAVIIIFPAFTYFILHKYKHKLEDEDFKGRFESLYLNVNT